VLLQPTTTGDNELKYEMRIIAQNVEHYLLTRDDTGSVFPSLYPDRDQDENGMMSEMAGNPLSDSLWYFDGANTRIWVNVQELLKTVGTDVGRPLAATVDIGSEFYPLSVQLRQGLLIGVESELTQRRDLNFSVAHVAPKVSSGRERRRVALRLTAGLCLGRTSGALRVTSIELTRLSMRTLFS